MMEGFNFRSKSSRDGGMQMESYYGGKGGGPSNMQDLRCYSANYANSVQPNQLGKEIKMKKSKSSFESSSKTWSFNDPELQRKKRVASYKVYAVEGKMKGSLRKSFRWIKDTYTQAVYGWSICKIVHLFRLTQASRDKATCNKDEDIDYFHRLPTLVMCVSSSVQTTQYNTIQYNCPQHPEAFV
ncbi:hypothetical protein ERO13_A05G407000v2 [Gossypium hirsutum]|uniref:DUF3511 domain-containing protein n=3 Tax=Gossypium TaxID=3633 RepID=A0A5J5W246_GOSBA|nr:hypothetical protein ES319_A05G427400v1 [Gossypium barbadense]KAG4203551.1 hypothetical protein ERO13_A05G407000v2 [Gossypium hirsutum]TYH20775.1 hypothetical protein ES288_A05G455900v1 [Gossypium darwinii]TYJ38409.1 hypothetical protein E1A91_A05G441000v1 [Gossypium mustelinum]